MENLSAPRKKLMRDPLSLNGYLINVFLKLRCIFLAAFLFQGAFVYAQAPTLSYNGPQTYTQTVTIAPLAPNSSGVRALGYSTSALKLVTGLVQPSGVTLDALGHVFVVSNDHSKIFKASVGGGPKVLIGSYFNGPVSIAADAAGNVFVAEYSNADVKKIPAAGGTPVVVGGRIGDAASIAVDAAGNIFVINEYKRAIMEIPAGGGPMITLNYTFMSPIALAGDALGNLYVADDTNTGIIKIPAGGGAAVIIGSGLSGSYGVAVDASGNVFVLDGGLVKMFPAGSGNIITINDGFLQLQPDGVAADGSGNLYVSTIQNGSLEKIAPVGGYFIRPALPGRAFFNTATGTISGTPAVGRPATNYTVTAYNSFGSTSAIVNISVLAAAHNANLSHLHLSGSGLTPSFLSATISYTATVGTNMNAVEITPTTADATATVKVNGTPVTSGTPSAAIPLAIGLNTITTTVIAQDGTTAKTYTVTINRPGSTNANLSALHLSTGALSIGGLIALGVGGLTPSFLSTTTSYTAKVANGIASINVTPTTSDTGATVKINGTSVASGTASLPIALNTGPNTITVTVTAQDGTTQKTYTVTETRGLSSNANLATLGQSLVGLTPSFTPGNTSYTISTGNATTSMTLKPVSSDANATIKVDGTTVPSGTKTSPIALAVGPNTITTVVKSQDGTNTKTYTLTVTRASDGADSFAPAIGVTIPTAIGKTETPALADDGILLHQGVSPNGDGINDFLMIEKHQPIP